jgi:hypothetical protein
MPDPILMPLSLVPNPTMTTITLHDNDVVVLRHFPPKQAEAIARAIAATDRKNVVVLLFDDDKTMDVLDVKTMASLGWVRVEVSKN